MIQRRQAGHKLKASEWNEVIDRLNADVVDRRARQTQRPWFIVTAPPEEDVPAFSVFSIGDEGVVTAASGVLFSNGPIGLKQGTKGWAHAIGRYDVTAIAYDENDLPVVGQECGPVTDRKVGKSGSGLFCVFVDTTLKHAHCLCTTTTLRWWKLAQNLDPTTHDADAHPWVWDPEANDGDGDYGVDEAVTEKVRDTMKTLYGGNGKVALCRVIHSANGPVNEILVMDC